MLPNDAFWLESSADGKEKIRDVEKQGRVISAATAFTRYHHTLLTLPYVVGR